MIHKIDKIYSMSNLATLVAQAKGRGLRIAHCHGVFDLLHPGHMHYFESACELADLLVVTLTPDRYVNQGPGRPAFNQRLRAESVAALQMVDYVAIHEAPTAVEAIQRLRPDVYVQGRDSTRSDELKAGDLTPEEEAMRAVGGQLHVMNNVAYSSTSLLNTYFAAFSPQADAYLQHFRQRYSQSETIDKLKALQSLRVLVLGDIIIDEYHYCKAVGKSSKSATLTARFLSAERHAGGTLAVANHLAGFVREVHLVTCLGDPEDDRTFIYNHVQPNVQLHAIPQRGRPTVVKRRYVDPFQVSKMFEVLWLDSQEPLPEVEAAMQQQLSHLLPQCDLVIVADFGHGCIGQRTIQWLTQQKTFLALNTQTNSDNIGYNLVTKYPRADYICVDEEEMRLANQCRYGNLVDITTRTAQHMHSRLVSVTRGSSGSLTYACASEVIHTPVFSTDVVDSVGAGDAYLSITSLCARAGYDPAFIGFIGNCVGALAVRIVGNRESVQPEALHNFISTLLR